MTVSNLLCTACGAPHALLSLDSYNTLCEHNEWAAKAALEPITIRSATVGAMKPEANRETQAANLKDRRPPAKGVGGKTKKGSKGGKKPKC
jgi:hypothetical protein